jgi:predicted DNA-binding transcriptional regulator YafY
MLKLLPSRGTGSSAGQLTQSLIDLGYAVDKRTVERDLRKLTTLFPIVVDERSKPYGWRWADHARVDMPGMDVGEALSLALIEQYLKPALPATMVRVLTGRFRQAVDKLAALGSSNRSSRWLQKIKVVAPHCICCRQPFRTAFSKSVQEALIEDEQIEVAYRSADDEAHKSAAAAPARHRPARTEHLSGRHGIRLQRSRACWRCTG